MKSVFIKTLFIVCLMPLLLGQTTRKALAHAPEIDGTVVTANTHAPIAGVWVKWTEVNGWYRFAQTDKKGRYTFSTLENDNQVQILKLEKPDQIDTNLDGTLDSPYLYDTDLYHASGHFSCGDNPHQFGVVQPVGVNGTFSKISDVIINNGDGVRTLPPIIYTPPSGSPPPSTSPPISSSPSTPPQPSYIVSGNVFVDKNEDGIQDQGEHNYAQPFSLSINPNAGTITTNSDGSYIIKGLPQGTYSLSYLSLPNGYRMTTPLNQPPPPSYKISVGPGCTTNGAPGADCAGDNISNLNFGISDFIPWMQVSCGNWRNDKGVQNQEPSGEVAIATDPICTTSGIVFSGNTDPTFGLGQASTNNTIVGGFDYPELFPTNYTPLKESYPYLLSKATSTGIIPTDLTSSPVYCNLNNCTLPTNITHGIYIAKNSLTLNAFTVPANQNFIFLINGDLILKGPVIVPVGSTVLFSAKGNIKVSPIVGSAPNVPTTSLAGWYVAGKSFIIPTRRNCQDLRLNIAGTVIVNALRAGGTFVNDRDLCGNDITDPTVFIYQRLDMILNAPEFLKDQLVVTNEVTP